MDSPAVLPYFNENEPFAAEWLGNLWPGARIDARSVVDVRGSDLSGYRRVHLFAGIGGWEYALQLAGWGDQPIWTGSCPCQPFSAAGKRKAAADERHLWPEFRRLIGECRPPVVVGEQVASRLGREWLAGVFADLEGLGYAVAGADLCAAGVGAPHIRQRLYWVAYALLPGRPEGGTSAGHGSPARSSGSRWVAHTERHAGEPRRLAVQPRQGAPAPGAGPHAEPGRRGHPSGLAHADLQRRAGEHPLLRVTEDRAQAAGGGTTSWGDTWLQCLDGKARRVEPGIFPLAHGIPRRVGRLRAYGNAIVPQVAAVFLRAVMESVGIVPLAEAA
jgi:DNA (cytosine-5)-methyltransferase 1